jgi:DNA-binding CsgD family transcriptional regulator
LNKTNSNAARSRDAAALSDLVHAIYEAGLYPAQWNDTVAKVAASFGADKGLLFTPFVAPQHGGMIFPAGISEDMLQLWASAYIDRDIWAAGGAEKGILRAGTAWIDEDLVGREAFLASPFYREFLSKMGIARVCTGVVFDGEPGLPAVMLTAFRDDHEPAFNDDDKAWMQMLVRHVSRSLGIMQRLQTATLQKASLVASLDRLSFGVALLNSDMQVLHMNDAATRAIAREDGLRLNAGRQIEGASSTQHSAALTTWMRSVSDADVPAHFSDGFRVPRRDATQAYVIQCVPLTDSNGWHATGEDAKYVAFIVDPNALKLPSVERLVTLYGLTNAQANVALQFAQGGGYKFVAQRLSISEETVRSHVKDIYPKMRVTKQADMVRVVLSLSQAAL